ncbi:MAG: hypothetical protein AAF441_06620 [Pseudomonadota bacterium]
MKRLTLLWNGQLPLRDAFWTWAVIGGLAVNLVTSLAFTFFLIAGQLIPGILAGYGVSLPYNVLATVGVWRAADRFDGERHWADLAKLVTVAGMVLLSVT